MMIAGSISAALLLIAVPAQRNIFGERIVAYCRANIAQKVGDGDCYDLAQHALQAVGARPEFKYRNYPNKADYVWGVPVLYFEAGESGLKRAGKVKDLQPGDVIQMRDAKFEGKKSNGDGRYTLKFSHHTAIVSSVENNGKLIQILHQNFGGKKFVLEGSITPEHLQSGWIRIYRTNPK